MFGGILFDMFVCWVVLLLIGYLFVKETYGFFERRGIPYSKPVFLLGSTWRNVLGMENLVISCHRIYSENKGKAFVGMFQGLTPTIFLRDPKLIESVFINNFSHFHDRGLPTDEDNNPLEGSLFNLKGSKWRSIRNKLVPSFTTGKLKAMLHIVRESVESFVSELEQQKGNTVELKSLFTRLNLHIIGTCAFGLDLDTIKNPNSKFPQMCKRIFARDPKTFVKGVVRFFFPKFAKFFKFKIIPQETNDFFMDMVKDCFEQRIKLGIKRNDFMDILLELRQKGSIEIEDRNEDNDNQQDNTEEVENYALTDELLTAQAFGFFAGGFETTSTALGFLFYLLSKHQDVQDKLRQEIIKTKSTYGDFTYEALKSMTYAEACINESLRLYPAVGVLVRKCNNSTVLNHDLRINKDMLIFISVFSIHRDEEFYPQPLTYNPDRFIKSSPSKCTFLPFGDGPRMCIARQFASLVMKATVVEILTKYKVETSPIMSNFEPIQYLPRAFVTTPKDGLHCIFNKLPDSK